MRWWTARPRSVLGLVGTVGLAAALAACGGGSPAAGGGSPSGGGASGQALRVGTVTQATVWDPPLTPQAVNADMYFPLVYDQLLQLDKTGKVVGMVATDYSQSTDGRSLTLKLRTDVKFPDGTPLDSAVVKANLERSKTLQGSLVAAQLATMSTVDAPDPQTVTVSFSRPAFGFPTLLASDARISSMVEPKAFNDPNLSTTPAGSGPYKLVSQTSGATVFDRVGSSWDQDAGRVPSIQLQVIPQASARMNALKGGQLDATVVVPNELPDATAAESASSGKLVFTNYDAAATMITLAPNTKKSSALADPRVRAAISRAIDRTALCQTVYGAGGRPTQQLFAPTVPGWVADLDAAPALAPDSAQAQSLMAQSGLGPVHLDVVVYNNPALLSAVQILQSQLAPVGITLATNVQPAATAPALFAQGTGDMLLGTSLPSLDPGTVIDNNIAGGRGFGLPDYLAGPATAAAAAAAGDARTADYQAISTALAQQPYTIPLCGLKSIFLGTTTLAGMDNQAYALLGPIPALRYVGFTAGS